MRCMSVISKPAGPLLVINSNGGFGKAAPTLNGDVALPLQGTTMPIASSGNEASSRRRFISSSSSGLPIRSVLRTLPPLRSEHYSSIRAVLAHPLSRSGLLNAAADGTRA